jgi:hypothetical protein
MTNRELANLVWPYMRHQAYCNRFSATEDDCHCGLIGIRRRIKQATREEPMVGHIGGPDNSSVQNDDGSVTVTLTKSERGIGLSENIVVMPKTGE